MPRPPFTIHRGFNFDVSLSTALYIAFPEVHNKYSFNVYVIDVPSFRKLKIELLIPAYFVDA